MSITTKENTVLSKLKTLLTADTTLKSYIKNVFMGWNDLNSLDMLPAITIEPKDTDDSRPTLTTTNKRIHITQSVDLIVEFYCADVNYQIIGRASSTGVTEIKGITSICNDIKDCLDGYPSIDGTCTRFEYGKTIYSPALLQNILYRQAIITLKIYIESNDGR